VAGRSKKAAKQVNRRTRGATAVSYDQWARRALAANADLSFEYLREVLERSDRPEELLLGLRRIAIMHCGAVLDLNLIVLVPILSRNASWFFMTAPK
jgi:hypothetical protein